MRSFAALLAVASFATLAACDVDKTEEGQAPDVDVNAGELPEYDVEGPDVNVGTTTENVQVPDIDVDTTTQTVETPTVDVDAPQE